MQENFEAFHGTSKQIANVILKDGFKKSVGDEQWLGDGVYFFTHGLTDPQEAAEQWAKYKAWDNKRSFYSFNMAAVIKAGVNVDDDNLLNLTTQDGIELLDYIEQKCIKKINRSRLTFEDGYLINFAREQIADLPEIKVVIGDVFIQLSETQRINKIHRRTPNCTICCVNDAECIQDVKLLKTWAI